MRFGKEKGNPVDEDYESGREGDEDEDCGELRRKRDV